MESKGKAVVEPEKILAFKFTGTEKEVTEVQTILYALSIGFSEHPKTKKDLKFVYELHEDFSVFPTFSVVSHGVNLFEVLTSCPGLPSFNPMMLLHAEQRSIFHKPILPGRKYISDAVVDNVVDKGKMGLFAFKISTYELTEDGKRELATVNIFNILIRGLGGFGYKGKEVEQIPNPPQRKADKEFVATTNDNQAIIYRLNGDTNPLHIDPDMAEMGGFNKPIIHGLCTYGLAARGVYELFCDGDVNKLREISGRFTSHVFPGETVHFDYWVEGPIVIFSGKTVERGKEVLRGAATILRASPKL